MGKISRIQLRGISRTPSDRLTTDGGCAESLNVSLDNTELAPAFVPDDVTGKLGLPDGLQAEKVFVHKTANYENFIVVTEESIAVVKDGNYEAFATIDKDESVIDITSIGNTLAISTNKQTLFALYKNKKYLVFEGGLPKVRLDFVNVDELARHNDAVELVAHNGTVFKLEGYPTIELGVEENAYRVESERGRELLTKVCEEYQKILDYNAKRGSFSAPLFLMYGIRLYDGSIVNLSSPVMLGSAFYYESTKKNLPVNIRVLKDVAADGGRAYDYTVSIDVCNPFKIGIYKFIEDIDLTLWKDIISSVDVFVSPTVNFFPDRNIRAKWGEKEEFAGLEYDTIILDPANSLDEAKRENSITSVATFNLIKSYTLQEIKNAKQEMEVITEDLTQDKLAIKELLYSSANEISYGDVSLQKMITFNGKVISAGGSQILSRGLHSLNGLHAHQGAEEYSYSFKYYVETQSSGELVSISENIVLGGQYIEPKTGQCYSRQGQSVSVVESMSEPFTWLSFPDSRCTKVEILKRRSDGTGGIYIGRVEMKPHPLLPNVSYAYLGLGNSLYNEVVYELDQTSYPEDMDEFDRKDESRKEDLTNKVIASKSDNPFVYPAKGRITMDSNVISLAVATSALSQGQFGQFPLYVFTEDGIWAMETAADGSFVTSKPLSRDVCTNPASITSIDNAVVFVTDKGVMLLQGSQVVNISSYMNGKHYTIEETAKVILEKTIEETIAKISKAPVDQMAQVIQNEVSQSISQQETRASIERTAHSIIAEEEFFKDLLPILSDSTHFMAFIKDATIAYDYPGQRLIFIKKDEKYQYIYKLDSNTWHKTAYGLNLQSPLNSYPECLVQGEKHQKIVRTFWKVIEYQSQEEMDYLADRIRVKLPDITDREVQSFLDFDHVIEVTHLNEDDREWLYVEMDTYHVVTQFEEREEEGAFTRIYDLSTILDAADSRIPTRGVIATRPFNLDAPDVLKTITDIKIRGQYARGAVKYILLGSMDGINFYVIGTKRGKAWKMFRLIILADLDPTERISWVDVVYEEKFTNRLR